MKGKSSMGLCAIE